MQGKVVWICDFRVAIEPAILMATSATAVTSATAATAVTSATAAAGGIDMARGCMLRQKCILLCSYLGLTALHICILVGGFASHLLSQINNNKNSCNQKWYVYGR